MEGNPQWTEVLLKVINCLVQALNDLETDKITKESLFAQRDAAKAILWLWECRDMSLDLDHRQTSEETRSEVDR